MVSNDTSPGLEPAFVPEPRGRGTVGLLTSCLFTLGLCIWTSVHRDILPISSTRENVLHKGAWMSLALLVPEIVVGNAFHQWREAKQLYKRWCQIYKVNPGDPEDTLGMEGAFFVVMGGCTVLGEDGQTHTLTLTPNGFLYLASSGMIKKDILIKKDITDKGKADVVAKVLVCVQAFWMVIQCAARKLNDLPVTILEYHVVIQVLYGMAMYGFWWYKPMDVNEPIPLIEYKALRHDREDGPQESDAFLKEWSTFVKERPQSRRLVCDDLICSGFSGHTDALTAAILSLPTSLCHALAWNCHFPTSVERWIWRVTSIGIGIAPQCMYLHFVASPYINRCTWSYQETDPLYRRVHNLIMEKFPVDRNKSRPIETPIELTLPGISFYITCWFNIHIYSVFSVLLTVVAFMSLRSIPEGSYKTVSWGDYLPHL